MDDPISERLVSISKINKSELHDLWKQLFEHVPSSRVRRDIMIPILAYRLQEKALGELTVEAKRKLSTFARTLERNANAEFLYPRSIKQGTRLVRQWHDKVHVVEVEKRGYKYNGSSYESLSEIARLITGTRWSGPVFFGIKGRGTTKPPEAA